MTFPALSLVSDPNKPYQIRVLPPQEDHATKQTAHPPSSQHAAREASPIPRVREATLRGAERLGMRNGDANNPLVDGTRKECAMMQELRSHGIRTHRKASPLKNVVVDTSLSQLVDDQKEVSSPVTLSLPVGRVPRAPARQPNACWACCLKCLQWLCGQPDP